MPIFRTTYQILTGEGEYFDPNWMDSDKLILPPRDYWDYQRELRVEDVNVWEMITEPWDIGVYAAWDPYAEFYLIRFDKDYTNPNVDWQQNVRDKKRNFEFETHYGKGAQAAVQKRLKELNVNFITNDVWVEPDDMWLYTKD